MEQRKPTAFDQCLSFVLVSLMLAWLLAQFLAPFLLVWFIVHKW